MKSKKIIIISLESEIWNFQDLVAEDSRRLRYDAASMGWAIDTPHCNIYGDRR